MRTGFDVNAWLELLLGRLRDAWGDRLLFVGHIGSWVRGEAGPESDIDINVVLDRVEPADVVEYRRIVREMPESEKACGCLLGKEELQAWPRSDLFQCMCGCRTLHGSLDGLVEKPTAPDLADFIRISASMILHGTRHAMIYAPNQLQAVHDLEPFYKGAFFIMQAWIALRDGVYIPSKREMLDYLSDSSDRNILRAGMGWNGLADDRERRGEYYFILLAEWSAGMLRKVNGLAKPKFISIEALT